MSDVRFESALAAREAPKDLAVDIREITTRGMIDLRGLASDSKFMAAAKEVLGLDLPTAPRSSAAWGEIQALWLSTDQWLILCPRAKTAELLGNLRQAFEGIHSFAVDVSDMRTIIRLEGDDARFVLLKGSSLDLLSSDYEAGAVRRLRFAEIAALLHIVSQKPDVIDLYVFRSYANYAWDWLLANGRSAAAIRPFGRQAPPAV
ncbi:sarcosine oxidase subunit gamma [Taklimakanibacter deserti]|uniref:sarcosine oxidase subunit gamma n=1 Tax=Taklimakanibacter deserti TaxID=2267839 RepID=UPI0013C47345